MNHDDQNLKFSSVCLGALCPEVLKTEGAISLRNPNQPEKVVEFSQQEWEELRRAFVENRV